MHCWLLVSYLFVIIFRVTHSLGPIIKLENLVRLKDFFPKQTLALNGVLTYFIGSRGPGRLLPLPQPSLA